MTKITTNIDREKRYIALTRKFPLADGQPMYTEIVYFTEEDAIAYIGALISAIQKLHETPVPSGPKPS